MMKIDREDWGWIHDCIFASLDDCFGEEFSEEYLEMCIEDMKQNIIDNYEGCSDD